MTRLLRLVGINDGELSIHVEEREVARLGPGEHLGELALLEDRQRSATVRAVSDATLLRLEVSSFREALSGHPEIARALLANLDRQIKDRQGSKSSLELSPSSVERVSDPDGEVVSGVAGLVPVISALRRVPMFLGLSQESLLTLAMCQAKLPGTTSPTTIPPLSLPILRTDSSHRRGRPRCCRRGIREASPRARRSDH